MEKITAFFKVIYLSFFSAAFYRDVYANLQGKKLGYISMVITLVSLITAVTISLSAWDILDRNALQEQVEFIADQLPLMTITKGELYLANKEQTRPIMITNKEGKTVIVIDDQAKDNKYQSEDALVVVAKNGVFFMNNTQIKFEALFKEKTIEITKENVIKTWAMCLEILKIILPISGFVITFISLFFNAISYSAIFAWIMRLFLKNSQEETVEFTPLFRLGIFASIPAIILSMIQPLISIDIIWMTLIYFTFTYYSVFHNKTKAS